MDEEYNPELDDSIASGLSDDAGRPRIRKAADAFRTISEVADELHVPQHVLRFWETKFPQVRPLKRGGGRRYYRPEDVGLLRRVADLLYTQGYTIKGVQRLLRDGGIAVPEPRAAAPAPAPQQEFLIPPEPEPAQVQDYPVEAPPAANFEPHSEAPVSFGPPGEWPGLQEDTEPVLESAPEQLPSVAYQAQPQLAQNSDNEAARLRSLLAEALDALEELRRALG